MLLKNKRGILFNFQWNFLTQRPNNQIDKEERIMFQRPKTRVLTPEAQQAILEASMGQTGKPQVIKTYDPNFPVFDVPVNSKRLVYVPNHVMQGLDGSLDLRCDKFAAHAVMDGRIHQYLRCSSGINIPELGLDGTCPICDSVQDCWDLANRQYEDVGKSKGIDIKSEVAKTMLEKDRKDIYNTRVVKEAEVWRTFPIVVIDCEEENGVVKVVPKKDAEGKISGTPMWYSIRESTYQDKWIKALNSASDADGNIPTSPAGFWVVLDFTYTSKDGKHDKMQSAKSLQVSIRQMNAYEQWATYFDQITVDWTPAKAQEVVVLDALRTPAELEEIRDNLMKGTWDKLAMYNLATSPAVAPQLQTNADAALANFGGVAQPAQIPAQPAVGAVPQPAVGEMPAPAQAVAGAVPQQVAGTMPAPAQPMAGEMPVPANLTAEVPTVGVQ